MKLAYTALLVRDYDEAISWYTSALGFSLTADDDLGSGKRWVVIEAVGGGALLLAKARKPGELAAVGDQFGGRVGLFLNVNDFDAAYRRLVEHEAQFEEQPRSEDYGKVVVFRDLYGNRWDLIERRSLTSPHRNRGRSVGSE